MHPLRPRGSAANQQTAVRVPFTTRERKGVVVEVYCDNAGDRNGRDMCPRCKLGQEVQSTLQRNSEGDCDLSCNEDSNNGMHRNRSHMLWGELLNSQPCDTHATAGQGRRRLGSNHRSRNPTKTQLVSELTDLLSKRGDLLLVCLAHIHQLMDQFPPTLRPPRVEALVEWEGWLLEEQEALKEILAMEQLEGNDGKVQLSKWDKRNWTASLAMPWNESVRLATCYKTPHRKRGCPTQGGRPHAPC